MNDDEKYLVKLLGQCFNRFDELPVIHSADRGEFIHHLHALQNIVLSRPATRQTRAENIMAGEKI